MQARGGYAALAAHALNGLVGSTDNRGLFYGWDTQPLVIGGMMIPGLPDPVVAAYGSGQLGALRRTVNDERVKARPTFHYRLPDCRVNEPGWSVADAWNRWVYVESLAADTDLLAELIDACEKGRDHDADPLQFYMKYMRRHLNVGFFSRNREINTDSSFSVIG